MFRGIQGVLAGLPHLPPPESWVPPVPQWRSCQRTPKEVTDDLGQKPSQLVPGPAQSPKAPWGGGGGELERAYLPRLGGGVPDAVQAVLGHSLGACGFEQPTMQVLRVRSSWLPGCMSCYTQALSCPPTPGTAARRQSQWVYRSPSFPLYSDQRLPDTTSSGRDPEAGRQGDPDLISTEARGGADLSTSQDSVVLMKTELGSGTWKRPAEVTGQA